MGQYRQAQITNAGLTLIEQAQITENALTFTALKTGNGEYTGEEDLKLCTELKNAKNTFTIAKVTQEEQKIKIASQITNEDVPEGYSITEIGIFGQLDGGEETLIAITSSVNPDFLPATTITPSTILVEVHLEVTNADDVEFTYTIPEGVYATLEDYEEQNVRLEEVDEKLKELENPEYDISRQKDVENLSSGESLKVALRKIAKAVKTLIEHLANKKNPHGVTKSQVGLSNVPNVTTNNQTPTYTVSQSLSELSSGETLSVAFGKLSKAVADYISHKADQVVHITAEERNAWNAKLGVEKIANNLTTNTYGKVLDAYQGKNLLEKINNLTTTQDGTVQTNINWNTIKVPGLFRYLIRANEPGMNAPELNIPFYLVVIKKDDNNLEQWAYSAASNVRYTRVYASGEWGAWAKVLTNEDIAANLATDRSDMLLAASMGKNLQDQINTLNSNNFTWLEVGRDGRTIFPQPNGVGFFRVKTSVEAPSENLREYFVISMTDGIDWIVQYWFDTWYNDDYHIWVRKCNINESTSGSWTWCAFKQII